MRKALLAAAAGVVLVANGWGVLQALRNRSEPSGGRLELTERELSLEPVALESTATILRLNWNVLTSGNEDYGPVPWLDVAKLTELGFDCRVPVSSPNARSHYTSLPPMPVFLVLEYEGDAWRNAPAKVKTKTRLYVVDAARDPHHLRGRYSDPQRHIICRGLARLHIREREMREGALLSTPRIEGRIQTVYPAQLLVPPPHNKALIPFRRNISDGPDQGLPTEPRFVARVCWGAHYEPWVEEIRLLDPSAAKVKQP